MKNQVMIALEEADVILFVVDGRSGYVVADGEVADLLRRTHKPVVLVVNKIDGQRQEELTADFWALGIQPMLAVSAEHGRGIYELLEAVIERLPPDDTVEDALEDDETFEIADVPEDEEAEVDTERVIGLGEEVPAIQVAVIGRPNIGKSTLLNQMIGEERHLVHDMPGTTMDPVDSKLEVDGRTYILVDTAGVRRKSKIEDALERFVSLRAIQAIERAHVCLLMIDATVGITEQDAKLAQLVNERGRALILLFNKWDLVKGMEEMDSHVIEDQIHEKLPHATWAPHLFVSAKTGKGVHRILPTIDRIYEQFNRHIGTAEVNRFLERVSATHSPPQRHHRPVRLYYAAQIRVRPPSFVFFSNTPEGVVPAYRSFLSNRLREEYGLEGTPIRMYFRKRRKAALEE
jgi:GTP-binding protein